MNSTLKREHSFKNFEIIPFQEPEKDPRPFSWKDFMKERAMIPAKSPLLFPHVRFLEKTVAERLYPPGMEVDMKTEDGTVKRVKIEVVCHDMALVEFVGNEGKVEWLPLMSLGRPEFNCDGLEWMWEQSDVLMLFDNDKTQIFQKIGDFIKVSQVFELQNKNNPTLVDIVKIIENYDGLVKVEFLDGQTTHVHITSELCHRLGWSANNFEHVEPCKDDDLANQDYEPVPAWVFESKILKEHRFEAGMMLEVLDPKTRMIFYPGYVSKVLNKYHFMVKVVEDINEDKEKMQEIVCHRGSSEIYPANWCQKQNLRFTAPKGIIESDFSFSTLRQKLGLRQACAPDSFFDIPRSHKKIEKMRNLEFYDDTLPMKKLIPATIIRSYKHFVWIHLENSTRCTPPRMYSCRSMNLFPCEFGQKSGFAYIQMDKMPSFSVRKFDLSNTFTSQKTPVFYEGKKRFLSQVWLKGDLWLPAIYVNTKCVSGPFINPDRVKMLNGRYGPGPLPLIMKQILSDLIGCTYRTRELADVIAADKNSKLPKIQAKCRKNYRRVRVNIECCEQLSEFGGWLRTFLTQMDACPNLISFDKRDNCPAQCSILAQEPYMNQNGHVNMAHLSTIPTKQLPKKLPSTISGVRSKKGRGGGFKMRIVLPQRPAYVDDEASRDSIITTTTSTDSDSMDSSDLSEDAQGQGWPPESNFVSFVQNSDVNTPVGRVRIHSNGSGNLRPGSAGGIVVTRANNGQGPRIRAPAVSLISYSVNGRPFMGRAPQIQPSLLSEMPRLPSMRRFHSSEQLQSTTRPSLEGPPPRLTLMRPPIQGRFSNTSTPTTSTDFTTPTQDQKKRSPLQATPSVSPNHPPITSNPMKWSSEQLAEWIRQTDCSSITEKLLEEDVDGEALMLLSFEGCKKHLSLKLGPAIKLSALIEELKKSSTKFQNTP